MHSDNGVCGAFGLYDWLVSRIDHSRSSAAPPFPGTTLQTSSQPHYSVQKVQKRKGAHVEQLSPKIPQTFHMNASMRGLVNNLRESY
ncbi:hypothetical protein Y032_0103g3591 [Ancylostoma ceylanicum]|uniref:Uncharacterized protein n=1 Tax=Ancylostoma ceylanicum TaxID=53326 RepID=A0A016TH76_9BILA|nr:hypothetical protein Y032_0103g3591 [Ancylostoma ceylanicum]